MANVANRLGIELLTVMGMPPVAHIALAAKLGCSHISTGLLGIPLQQLGVADGPFFPDWSLASDANLRAEMKAAMRDTGVRISLGEGFRVRPDGDVADAAAGLDIMAELGAERINAVSMEMDLARSADQLSALSAMVRVRGMAFTIEFAPPNAINSLASALAVREQIGAEHCTLLIDAMHFFRSGGSIEELRALDPAAIGYAQLCDVPLAPSAASYMQEAMFARWAPGTGELPLEDFVAALPRDVPIGIEVPNIAAIRAEGGPEGMAGRAVEGALAILESLH